MKIEELKMYLVRNSSGQYYRRVGYGGYGQCWVDDVAYASVWTKQSPARSRITWFANHYPTYPAPDLIEIAAGTVTVHDQKERVKKAQEAQARAVERAKVRQHKREVEHAQRKLAEAEARLKKVKGDT